MTRVAVRPELLRWACGRVGLDLQDLAKRFPQLPAWGHGRKQPTLKQIEAFAKATHTPIGFLFLEKPPEEKVPIPDFRTVADRDHGRPSPDLLDTVYLCQQRQDWYRDFARGAGFEKLAFVGSLQTGTDVVMAAKKMRETLGFSVAARRALPTWTDALRKFIELAEGLGILIMVSGIVRNNTHRTLDPQEFRGFALADELAPLIFINGADTKSAQMFTLAHELVHIWIGETALSDAEASMPPKQKTERWCNEVAAELLVPLEAFRAEHRQKAELRGEIDRLARVFKVSTLVVLRRMHDAGTLRGNAYWEAYDKEIMHLSFLPKGSGGNFYLTQAARNSRRFVHALIADTLEGNTLYRDAFRMLGIARESTFREMSTQMGYEL
jgi:Zn-dependent peptidase ImmA (M78 family)